MRRKRIFDPNSMIVMTPMIDIMTVLLAVFIVTAPMLTSAIDLDLPVAGHSMATGEAAASVSVDRAGHYFMGDVQMNADAIVKKLVAMRAENPKITIMINGDRGASYGAVMGMMGALKDAGFVRVGLRTAME